MSLFKYNKKTNKNENKNARNNAVDFYKYCRYNLGLSHAESLSKAKLIDSSFCCQDGEY